ncbi:alpha/beta hydrolase [Candidatus Margulisiibacteriota bacterium]
MRFLFRLFRKSLNIFTVSIGWLFYGNYLVNQAIYTPRYSLDDIPEHWPAPYKHPKELSLKSENVRFFTDDDVLLKGWFIPGTIRDKAIIFVHGRNGNRIRPLRHMQWVKKLGYSALFFDLRGTGESTGSFSSMGYFETRDVQAAINYLLTKKHISSICIHAVSMGAAAALRASIVDTAVKALILESPFSSAKEIMLYVAKKKRNIPHLFTRWGLFWFRLRLQFNLDQLDLAKNIKKIAQPLLIVHGTHDEIVPVTHGKKLFNIAREPKELLLIPGAEHDLVYEKNPRKYVSAVKKFLKKYF